MDTFVLAGEGYRSFMASITVIDIIEHGINKNPGLCKIVVVSTYRISLIVLSIIKHGDLA